MTQTSPRTTGKERTVATTRGRGDEPFPDRRKEHALQLAAIRTSAHIASSHPPPSA